MYANTQSGTRLYRQNAAQHTVDTADGYTLIRSLLQKLVAHLAMAKHYLQEDDISQKAEHLTNAIGIVDVLQVSVEPKHHPELGDNLIALYDYIARQLLAANLHNDVARINEVEGLVREVKQAWDAIAGSASSNTASAMQG
ncbi:MAG: flagellar export chaperone FliS [Pseudomonadota bacterium]